MSNFKNLNYSVKYPQKETATAFLPDNEIPFAIAVIGITYPLADYYVTRLSTSKTVDLEYVTSGKGEVLIDGEWMTASAGDVMILRCGEAHEYRALPDNPWQKLWINYIAGYIRPFLDSYRIKSGIYHVPDIRQYFDLAAELALNAEMSADTCYKIADCVHEIISAIAIHSELGTKNDAGRIREALNASVYKKVDLTELAERLHISKSSMIRIFKKHYGMTPYEYLLSAKIESAKLLLASTEMPIREISDKLCISDEHYFSTLFLQRVGIRPREYRRKNKL
ncbi:MAG: AraC family transcriptional regulator [Clostridia bacterium]|nr:AraC family transcriptional regulator [Clostridia bacterium]